MSDNIQTWWWFRHAPPINPADLCYGQSEVITDLTSPEVRVRLEELAAALPSEDAVWLASSLRRTFAAASEIRKIKGVQVDIFCDKILNEQSFGYWQRKPTLSLQSNPHFLRYLVDPANVTPPGGENMTTFFRRVAEGIGQRQSMHNEAAHIISGGHGGALRAAVALAQKIPIEMTLKSHKIKPLDGIRTYYDRDAKDWLPRIDRF